MPLARGRLRLQGLLVEAKESATRMEHQVDIFDSAQKRFLGHR